MAFDKKGWRVWSAGTVPYLPRGWGYNSEDALADIIASGYFDEVTNEIKKGCMLYITASDNEGIFYRVTSDRGVTPVTVELIPSSVT